ncbi:MAG: DUF58 domain-containing protein [Verrucomicrobia bacterium]|nr:DUF58 domain-containing protein [Deltaproteobacteria bacterium]
MTLLLGFSAVNTGNNLLFLIVSGLLAFMSVTGLAGMLNLKGLTPQLLPPSEAFAGSATPFRIRICNAKHRIPSFLIRVNCSDDQGVTIPVVPANSVVERSVSLLFSRRGPARLGTITISSPFPVDFFTRFWTFTSEDEFVVFPRLIAGLATGAGTEQRQIGTAIRHERGQDGELERIAAYSGREPLRVIHWKLSARGDDLLVKEFGRQTAPPLVIDLDTLTGYTLEDRISQAAWLVRRWVHQRPVGLCRGGKTIPPASGRAQGALLLKDLALYGLD